MVLMMMTTMMLTMTLLMMLVLMLAFVPLMLWQWEVCAAQALHPMKIRNMGGISMHDSGWMQPWSHISDICAPSS
eukprot:813349-Pyramimonas_sp.AAC.1